MGPRFRSALLSALRFSAQSLVHLGSVFVFSPEVVDGSLEYLRRVGTETDLEPPYEPLSRAERAEWAALVERLR